MNSASVSADHSFSGVVRMYETYTNVDLLIGFLQSSFEIVERLEAPLFELGNPALVDLLERHRIEEMQLFAAAPHRRDEVRLLEHGEVLRHALPGHVEVLAELVQGLAIVRVEQIEQL